MANTISRIAIFLLMLSSINSYCQESVWIKGYVIFDKQTIPNITVSVLGKETEVVTNSVGRFKIRCAIGDTLIINNNDKGYCKDEKYIVRDESLVIVNLTREIKLSEDGRRRDFWGRFTVSMAKHSFQISASCLDKNMFAVGYNYYLEPFFPDKPYIPIENNITIGANLVYYDNNFFWFPNANFEIKKYFDNRPFPLFPLRPTIKIGYLIDSKWENNKFGYEFSLELLQLMHKSILFVFSSSYNNYKDGTVMINLSLKIYNRKNEIPKFIKEGIFK